MNEFSGFPARQQFTAVPNAVFSAVLPRIADIVELKVLLHFLALAYAKKGVLRALSLNELLNDPALVEDLREPPACLAEKVPQALAALEAKNVLTHAAFTQDGQTQELYALNSEANRAALAKARLGELPPPEVNAGAVAPEAAKQPAADVFSLYEQNIGILTPLIAEELKEAQMHYPQNWIADAIKEAVNLNRRNWRYIARILEGWSTEGKDSGTHRGHIKAATDPDKYVRGKYGHMVQR